MFKSIAFTQLLSVNKYYRPAICFHPLRKISDDESKHPIWRTLKMLKNDMSKIKDFFISLTENKDEVACKKEQSYTTDTFNAGRLLYDSEFQTHCDVLVIGGGGIGSSIAYWLKKQARDGLSVVVVEHKSHHSSPGAYSTLPVGGLCQQFLLPENIEMSLFGADFLRNAKENLDGVDIKFDPHGFLILASDEDAETLKRMSHMQNEFGVRTEILTRNRLNAKFPWLNTDGVALGCHGLEKHGWFDANSLIMGLRYSAKKYGAHFFNAEVIGFEFQSDPNIAESNAQMNTFCGLDKVILKMPNGDTRTIKFAICVVAAGAYSEKIANFANIGKGTGILRVPLTIQRRKCYGCTFNSEGENTPGIGTPCTIDLNGAQFRRNGLGGNYITGFTVRRNSDSDDSLEKNYEHFGNVILPTLMQRVKTFKALKVIDTWESDYEYNAFDENGIVGPHSFYNNLYFATGFSGLGLQQSPAVGRAISELIMDARFRTIDLSRLGFDRIVVNRPLFEFSTM